MSNSNKKKKTKKEILFSSLVTIIAIALISLCIILICKLSIEKKHQDDYDRLIDSYYEQQEIKNDYSLYDKDTVSTNGDSVEFKLNNVDAILRVEALDIVMPICSGNYVADIEAFRISTLSPEMVLGKTTYTIMGHHAKMLNCSFGWLHKLEIGTPITLEKDREIYNYVVDDIYVGYAADMPELFTILDEDVVYMATCDYTLGRSSKIVYRVAKCTRY